MTRKIKPQQVGRGQPTKLNTVIATAIINTLAQGTYVTTACTFVGIAPQTYRNWRNAGAQEMDRLRTLGEDPELIVASVMTGMDEDGRITTKSVEDMFRYCPEPFDVNEWATVVFYVLTERAQAAAEIQALTQIRRAGTGDRENKPQWQALGWILERTHRERYGRMDRISVEGSTPGSPVKVEMSVEDVESRIRALLGE